MEKAPSLQRKQIQERKYIDVYRIGPIAFHVTRVYMQASAQSIVATRTATTFPLHVTSSLNSLESVLPISSPFCRDSDVTLRNREDALEPGESRRDVRSPRSHPPLTISPPAALNSVVKKPKSPQPRPWRGGLVHHLEPTSYWRPEARKLPGMDSSNVAPVPIGELVPRPYRDVCLNKSVGLAACQDREDACYVLPHESRPTLPSLTSRTDQAVVARRKAQVHYSIEGCRCACDGARACDSFAVILSAVCPRTRGRTVAISTPLNGRCGVAIQSHILHTMLSLPFSRPLPTSSLFNDNYFQTEK
ncbi:hypothetical protein J6590_069326 [Homalodisca vitripennis]|nr:hypothetical protein J6590_069326 [Homalodisca vitripennis]